MRDPQGSVGSSQSLEFVFQPELFFFQSRDPQLIPCGMGHLGFDLLLQFLMFVGDFSDVGL